MSWYLLKKRRHLGPFSQEQLKEALSRGVIASADFVITGEEYSSGQFDYKKISDIIHLDKNSIVPDSLEKNEELSTDFDGLEDQFTKSFEAIDLVQSPSLQNEAEQKLLNDLNQPEIIDDEGKSLSGGGRPKLFWIGTAALCFVLLSFSYYFLGSKLLGKDQNTLIGSAEENSQSLKKLKAPKKVSTSTRNTLRKTRRRRQEALKNVSLRPDPSFENDARDRAEELRDKKRQERRERLEDLKENRLAQEEPVNQKSKITDSDAAFDEFEGEIEDLGGFDELSDEVLDEVWDEESEYLE